MQELWTEFKWLRTGGKGTSDGLLSIH